MKLISCYIENFGNIKQRTVNFEKGLTSYCEYNGYGKTTLAGFLKAMFYGLKQTTARDKELGERARFYPFEGGKFGGNVTFEKDGVTYKIERFFGKKSATEDTLTVYADGEVLGAEDVGKEFFGIDEQSFLRTVFLNSSDTEMGATGDISRMLNGFIDDADYEGAKKILEKQQREYKAARGRGGKIDEKHDRVLRLQESIANREQINAGLSHKYEERNKLAQDIAELEAKGNCSRDSNLVLQKWHTYDSFLSDADGEREKLKLIEEKYPASLPDAEEIRELKRHAEALNLANERHITATISAEKSVRLEELSARFSRGVPTDGEISEANGRAAEMIRLEAEAANLEGLTRAGAEGKFAVRVPESEEVKRYGEKLVKLRENREASGKKKGAVGKKIAIVLAVLTVLALGAGAAMLALKNTLYGVVLMGVGGAAAVAALFAYFKGQLSLMAASTSKENTDLENEIKSFLIRYGYFSGGGIEVDYNNLVRDLEIYNTSRDEREKNTKLLEDKRGELNTVRGQVLGFLKKYGFSGDNAQADLTRLGALVAEYVALNSEKEEISARSDASREQIENHNSVIDNILDKYSIGHGENLRELLSQIERDRSDYDILNGNIERIERRASAFSEENGLTERPVEVVEDLAGLEALLSKKRDELSILDREISDDERLVENLSELKEEYETAREEEAVLRNKYELIVKTSELLERAERNLKDKYVSPVKNSFLKYSSLLESLLGEKVTFDKDFRIRFERAGEDRSDGHLSAGQRSLCALCLRLALIDNMYKQEKPFIIMDDPFVHLDKEHMGRAQTLLKELTRDRQIIYFCCHESRKI